MLNQTAIYAVRAIGFLAQHQGQGPILSAHIAEQMEIPRNFLSKILNRLAQGGVILTTRGRGGGVWLARPAGEIRLAEVVNLFMNLEDFSTCFLGAKSCDAGCGLHHRWRIISEQFEKLLNETTVDQIYGGPPAASPIPVAEPRDSGNRENGPGDRKTPKR